MASAIAISGNAALSSSRSLLLREFTGVQAGPILQVSIGRGRRRWAVQAVEATRLVPAAAAAAVDEPPVAEVAEAGYMKLAADLETASPLEIMDRALELFGDGIAIAFSSGAEHVASIEYAKLTGRPFRVISPDTGRLNPETYKFPEADEVLALVRSKGVFSFREDGHRECCRVRKVRPLRKALRGLKTWITGQRKDRSSGTRAHIPTVQVEPSFEGAGGGAGSLMIKWNPVANVDGKDVWKFLRGMDVPVNSLHSQGHVSIVCEPCTGPVLPGQHEREGRWQWEDAKAKECGLHRGNISRDDDAQKAGAAISSVNGTRDIFQSQAIVSLTRPWIGNWLVVLYAPWCRFCQAMGGSYIELAEKLSGSGIREPFAQQELQLGSFPTILFFPKHASKPIKYPSEKRDVDSLLEVISFLP